MKTKLILLIGLIIIAVSSCSKVLDKAPLDKISDIAVWNDPALIDAYVIDVFNEMAFLYNAQQDNTDNWATTFLSDITDEGHTAFSWINTTSFYKAGAMVASSVWPTKRWVYYSTIRKMNTFLEEIATSTLPDDQKNLRIGRIRFARAFTYFIIARDFGGVPLILKAQNANDPYDELYPKRNKEIEIYDFCISELTAIIDNNYLPAVAYDGGQPTEYAALALKSQVALYAANLAKWGTEQLDGVLGVPADRAQDLYQSSYDASKKIIDDAVFTLYNADANKIKNFRNLFLVKKNSEVIYAKEYIGLDKGVSHFWDNWNFPYGLGCWPGDGSCPYLEMAEEFEWTDGTPGTPGTLDRVAIQTGLWTLDELWGKKEPRFFASIYTHGSVFKGKTMDMTTGTTADPWARGANLSWDLNTGFGVLKYTDETNNPYWVDSKTDWIIFRYGYILLNHAEASFELGKTAEAMDAVNQVRTRAGVNLLTSVTRDNIRHERKIELAFENGYRYYDLKSWRTAKTVLSVQYSGLEYYFDVATSKLQLVVLTNIDGSTPPLFRDKDYYLPLTPAVIANNPNLGSENPGY
ncbi:MAG: RagB/SusD family nutrient uptake outer membrane protein [Bacteroidia bacterium]|nr:RagB/SusD family nutrient uptake outer membrane protein [Bacteroidia bacterium]